MARTAFARPPRGPSTLVVWLALGLACHGEATRRPSSGAGGSTAAQDPDAPASATANDEDEGADAAGQTKTAVEREPYTPPSTLGVALEIRVANRTRTVYAEPDPDSPLRGRILRKDNFHVYEHRDAAGCDEPWAKVAEGGWVCLSRTAIDDDAPEPLPIVAPGELLPFIYARHREHEDPETPAIPVYASAGALARGEAPVETLPAYGSYAFIRERTSHGRRVYVMASRRVVAAEELETLEPSEFGGRELVDAPIPAGKTLAWAVRWKTLIRVAADPEADVIERVRYHDTLYVTGEAVEGTDGETWFRVAEPAGWISDHDVRRFVPVAPPTPILAGQITVDVDLDEQVLSVWREDTPVFATLISSGKPGDATPIGLYRIETKWAYGKMASLASADEPYYVDAVPWAMYFDGRYALHAAYWHDLFGHRLSHGCVNLSPRDARRVFDLVTPSLPSGWLLVHEHARDPGALVRVRSGEKALPDHREPLTPPA